MKSRGLIWNSLEEAGKQHWFWEPNTSRLISYRFGRKSRNHLIQMRKESSCSRTIFSPMGIWHENDRVQTEKTSCQYDNRLLWCVRMGFKSKLAFKVSFRLALNLMKEHKALRTGLQLILEVVVIKRSILSHYVGKNMLFTKSSITIHPAHFSWRCFHNLSNNG